MAAPHVSGVAALILSKYPDVSLTQLRSQILNTTVSMPALQNKTVTGGRVDAFPRDGGGTRFRLVLPIEGPGPEVEPSQE